MRRRLPTPNSSRSIYPFLLVSSAFKKSMLVLCVCAKDCFLDLITPSTSSILRISFDVYVAFMSFCTQNPMVSFFYLWTSKGDEISDTKVNWIFNYLYLIYEAEWFERKDLYLRTDWYMYQAKALLSITPLNIVFCTLLNWKSNNVRPPIAIYAIK